MKEEEKLVKNTIEKERLQAHNAVRKLGSKLSGLMITCGFLVLIFGIYLLIATPDAFPSATLDIVFTGTLGFLGGLNILGGLLLLLGED